MTIRKESEPEREFDSGAKRQAAAGKGTPSLFPGDAYLDICKHFEDGAVHYGGRNWEKGLPLSSYIDSLERHIAQEKMGLTDESHDRAMAWNAICYLATKLRIAAGLLSKELDDLEGAYGKEQIIQHAVTGMEQMGFKKNDGCVIGQRSDGFYCICSLVNGYLWRDLRFHVCTGSGVIGNVDGYFSTREKAEECLRKYKGKQADKYDGYCEECHIKILTAEHGDLISICEECAKTGPRFIGKKGGD